MSIEKILKPIYKAVEKLESHASGQQEVAAYNADQERIHKETKEAALKERDRAYKLKAKIQAFLED